MQFTNIKVYLLNVLQQGRIGIMYEWTTEIKMLVHIQRLRTRKTLDLAV